MATPPITFEVINGPFLLDDICPVCRNPLNECPPIYGHNIPQIDCRIHNVCGNCLPQWLNIQASCPICKVPVQPLPPGVAPIIVPRELLDVGITVANLAALPDAVRTQILECAYDVERLIHAGVPFNSIVALPDAVRTQILERANDLARLIHAGVPFDAIMCAARCFKNSNRGMCFSG